MTPPPPRELAGAVTAAVVLVGLAALALPNAGVPRLVVLVAELLLAGGAAYLLDDAAVVLTAVAPIGLWRRRWPRLLAGVAVLGAAWATVVAVLRWQHSLAAPGVVSVEVAVLCLVAVAAAAALAARGEAEPGGTVAPVVGLLGIGALIADLVTPVAFFVPWDGSGGEGVRLVWAALGGSAVLVIAVASRDPAQPSSLRRA